MNRIGILHHPKIAESLPLATEIEAWLGAARDRNLASLLLRRRAARAVGGKAVRFWWCLAGMDLSCGRRGLPRCVGVPIFGVNLGRVGFLSEAQPTDWPEKLTKMLSGDFWTENRLMLSASDSTRPAVSNTAFRYSTTWLWGRGRQARVVRFQLHVDGDLVTNYTADALIVATPTGSTAYSMAAGGPLLPPQLPNFVVVPVAAHLTFDRAIIFHEQAEIAITVTMDHRAYLTPDGMDGILLESGDVVFVSKSANSCQFARVESSGYFYRRLMGRLGYTR